MRLVFIGPPGAGKGTQAQRLVKQLGIAHLSTGEMLRQELSARSGIGLRAEPFLQAGQLVPDELILELLFTRLRRPDCRTGWLFDGFPRTVPQATALDGFLAAEGTPLDGVLALLVSEDEIVRRLSDRGRADDRPETVRRRVVEYARQTAPLLQYYDKRGQLTSIDGAGAPDEVFGRVLAAVDTFARRPASRS